MKINNGKGLDWVAYEDDVFFVTCSTDQGTFKVESKGKEFRAKTFRGESAWSNAQRFVDDIIVKNKMGRRFVYFGGM